MLRQSILFAFAGLAVVAAGPAAAGPGGGGGHGMGSMHANFGVPHPMHVQAMGIGRLNSQGPYRASARGVLRSSGRSVLKGRTVVGGPIAGLTRGMAVVDVNGRRVGTVTRINTASGGRVVNVLVKSSTSARTIPFAPRALSVSGDVVTTTSLRRHSSL